MKERKILVIDDSDNILYNAVDLLKLEGFTVYGALNGKIGLDMAKQHLPDIILCDISMPVMDGFEVLEEIRKDENFITTPFIFLTAFSDKENMRMGMEKGADDYITKPFTRIELINAIKTQYKKMRTIQSRLQQKVDQVGRSITNAIPHEFRTVLNQVIGSANYLLKHNDVVQKHEVQQIASEIIDSGKRLLRITNNYLIYSRIEYVTTNPIEIENLFRYHTHEPAIVIEDIGLPIAQKYNREDDFNVQCNASGIFIKMSSDSYNKVLEEIIDNAFKFSKEGQIVKINATVVSDELRIAIKDNGIGMDDKQINNIAAYLQFDRDIYEQQGVGLGLIIAKKLVEIHNGRLDIIKNEDAGTTILISLPSYILEYN